MSTRNRERHVRKLVIIGLMLFATTPAMATSEGWFGGITAARSELQDFRLPTTNLDERSSAYAVFGGYQFSRHFALAGGYVNLGTYRAKGPSFGGFVNKIEVDGFHVFGVGILPVSSRVALLGSVGLFRWDYEFSSSDAFDPNRQLSGHGTSPTVGAAVNIDIGEKDGAFLHIGWQRFDKVGDRNSVEHENDYDLVLIGVTFHR